MLIQIYGRGIEIIYVEPIKPFDPPGRTLTRSLAEMEARLDP